MSEQQRPDERIAAIRERREGIPSPPWLNNTGEFVSQVGTYMAICRVNTPVVADWLRGKTVSGPPEAMQSLKEFIAHAPDDIDFLLQHITTLTAGWDAARTAVRQMFLAHGVLGEDAQTHEPHYCDCRGCTLARRLLRPTPADALAVWVPVDVARAVLPLVEIQAERCANSAVHCTDILQGPGIDEDSVLERRKAKMVEADRWESLARALASTPADALDHPISPELQDYYERVAAEEYPADERVQALVTAAQELLDDVYKVINGVERREGPPTWRNCRNLRDAMAALEEGGKAGE